ncbi:hypothetical protein ColLi_00474 [Colletotrichum liriopes]|uniref:Uncharacterized protein n=1 Tax=Colletotrichum liriopes TaxID=708192 RepID=A0AA37LMB6_9PEZI|nr:hypothetical protein ColLi_00474 [Colletotrichum liriopes]
MPLHRSILKVKWAQHDLRRVIAAKRRAGPELDSLAGSPQVDRVDDFPLQISRQHAKTTDFVKT